MSGVLGLSLDTGLPFWFIFWSALHDCAKGWDGGFTQWTGFPLALATLSSCDEGFRPQSNTGEGGTHAPRGPDASELCSSAALSILIFLFTVNSVEILFGFFQGKPLL